MSEARDSPGPNTSVIIATHDRAALLGRVLGDLASALLPDELLEVLVVENGGQAGAEGVCEAFVGALPVRYLFVAESGKSNALNTALDRSAASFIVFYDDDIRVDADNLKAFVDGARRYGPGHFFGGPVWPEYAGAPPVEWIRPWLDRSIVGWSLGEEEQPHHEFLGANWAAFRRDLLAAGGFVAGLGPSTEFRTLGEEVEIQERLADLGGRGIYLPRASVQHYVPEDHCTLRWAKQRRSRQHLSRVLLSPKHLDAPKIAGVPRFLWREYARDLVRVLAARLRAPRTPHRVQMEMKLAETAGRIAGYRRMRVNGAIETRES